MPAGSEGKIVAGLLIPRLKLSQKHLGHSMKREMVEGESFSVFMLA
jgi:hypothetical protein